MRDKQDTSRNTGHSPSLAGFGAGALPRGAGAIAGGFATEMPIRSGRIASAPVTRSRTHRYVVLAIVGDYSVAILSCFLAYWLRFHSVIKDMGLFEPLSFRQYTGHMLLGSVSLVAVMGFMGIYQRASLLRPRWVADRILHACVLWTLGFLTVTLALKLQPSISRVYTALNGVSAFVLLQMWRYLLNMILRDPRRLATLRQRTIFVGWNEDASRLWNSLRRDPWSALEVVGRVDTSGNATGELAELFPESARDGLAPRQLGTVADLEDLFHQHAVDVVILSDLNGPKEELLELASLCERELVQFKVIPSCFRIFISGLHLETMAGTPILGVDRLPLDSTFNLVLKRAVDIVGGAFGMLMSLPIIALFGMLVWIESRGSILYRQRRSGANGHPFNIYKIRSMKLDAETESGAKWCTANDPRRLRVGAFMRKWNIDELPQFWNVLKGEMSLVGPRPERPELIQGFKHQIPHYNARHHAKPGMTGWAQIKGLRGDTSLEERIKCDLWYLENWSLLLDFQIMIMTFFKRDNAY